MNRETKFSSLLSRAMDTLGYSFDAIKRRVEFYNTFNERQNSTFLSTVGYSYILAGSKREGVTLLLENDFDMMFSMNLIQCIDHRSNQQPASYVMLDRNEVPPGYTKLKFESGIPISNHYIDLWEIDSVRKSNFLSSSKFMTFVERMIPKLNAVEMKCRAGPSFPFKITTTFDGFSIESDRVVAFPCSCSDFMTAFCSRNRRYGFPSEDSILEISQREGHVVPVGHKGSDELDLQWRICYTLAEIKLIQSFNTTQYQLYVVLKMLVKQVLNPICPDITSYIVKNIVLWLIEITPRYYFQGEFLSKLIVRAIQFFQTLISGGYIPNYMIPTRNMLFGKASSYMKSALLKGVFALLDMGESMVLNCQEISKEMTVLYRNPGIYKSRLKVRDTYSEWCVNDPDLNGVYNPLLETFDINKIVAYLGDKKCIEIARQLCQLPRNIGKRSPAQELMQKLWSLPRVDSFHNSVIKSLPFGTVSSMTLIFEKLERIVEKHPEVMEGLALSGESTRQLEKLIPKLLLTGEQKMSPEKLIELCKSNPDILSSTITPEYIDNLLQQFEPYMWEMIAENPNLVKDMDGKIWVGNPKNAELRALESQLNNSDVKECLMKIMKGQSI